MATPSSRYKCIQDVCITGGVPVPIILCDNNGEFIAIVQQTNSGISVDEFDLNGNPYVPVGTIHVCGVTRDIEIRLFCDDNAGVITPYLVAYEYDESGAIIGTTITLIDGVTPYVPTGITRVCAGEDGDVEVAILCDDDVPFARQMIFDNTGMLVGTNDTTLDMSTPYVTSGTVGVCGGTSDIATLALNPINLVPSGVLNDERLTVTNAVTTSSIVLAAATTHIAWRIEGGSVRVTIDTSVPVGDVNPALGNGAIVVNRDSDIWHIDTWNAAKWIRNTNADGVIHASQMKPVGS